MKPTPRQRHKIIGAFNDITKSTPEKSLLAPKKHAGGRNNTGKMTVRYLGGSHKEIIILTLEEEKMVFLLQ